MVTEATPGRTVYSTEDTTHHELQAWVCGERDGHTDQQTPHKYASDNLTKVHTIPRRTDSLLSKGRQRQWSCTG